MSAPGEFRRAPSKVSDHPVLTIAGDEVTVKVTAGPPPVDEESAEEGLGQAGDLLETDAQQGDTEGLLAGANVGVVQTLEDVGDVV